MIDAHIHFDQYENSERSTILLKEMDQFGIIKLLTVSTGFGLM